MLPKQFVCLRLLRYAVIFYFYYNDLRDSGLASFASFQRRHSSQRMSQDSALENDGKVFGIYVYLFDNYIF